MHRWRGLKCVFTQLWHRLVIQRWPCVVDRTFKSSYWLAAMCLACREWSERQVGFARSVCRPWTLMAVGAPSLLWRERVSPTLEVSLWSSVSADFCKNCEAVFLLIATNTVTTELVKQYFCQLPQVLWSSVLPIATGTVKQYFCQLPQVLWSRVLPIATGTVKQYFCQLPQVLWSRVLPIATSTVNQCFADCHKYFADCHKYCEAVFLPITTSTVKQYFCQLPQYLWSNVSVDCWKYCNNRACEAVFLLIATNTLKWCFSWLLQELWSSVSADCHKFCDNTMCESLSFFSGRGLGEGTEGKTTWAPWGKVGWGGGHIVVGVVHSCKKIFLLLGPWKQNKKRGLELP